MYESLNGCGGNMFKFFQRKITSAREEKDKIYITEKSIFVYTIWGENPVSQRYIYSDCNMVQLIDSYEFPLEESKPVRFEDYIDKAATYEYVFSKNKEKYIFLGLKK